MSTARNECIWYGQCHEECPDGCGDYSPMDQSEQDAKYYQAALVERAEEYESIVREFMEWGRQD